MARKPVYIDPEIKKERDRIRQQYYQDVQSGKQKFPQHDFSKKPMTESPTPSQLARQSLVERGGTIVPNELVHDSAAAREFTKKTRTSSGAIVEDEFPAEEDDSMVKDKVDKQMQERTEHGGKRPDRPDANVTPDEQGKGFSDGVISKKEEADAHGGKLPQPDPSVDSDSENSEDSEDPSSIYIPDDWLDLDWNQKRTLARNFSNVPVTNKEQAENVIREEIERRNA